MISESVSPKAVHVELVGNPVRYTAKLTCHTRSFLALDTQSSNSSHRRHTAWYTARSPPATRAREGVHSTAFTAGTLGGRIALVQIIERKRTHFVHSKAEIEVTDGSGHLLS